LLEHLRAVIGLRAHAQRDPLNEYKSEAFGLFERLLSDLRVDVTRQLGGLRPLTAEERAEREKMIAEMQEQMRARAEAAAAEAERERQAERATAPAGAMAYASERLAARAAQMVDDPEDPETWRTTGRNQPCPCGSGKKYKHCHGRL